MYKMYAYYVCTVVVCMCVWYVSMYGCKLCVYVWRVCSVCVRVCMCVMLCVYVWYLCVLCVVLYIVRNVRCMYVCLHVAYV